MASVLGACCALEPSSAGAADQRDYVTLGAEITLTGFGSASWQVGYGPALNYAHWFGPPPLSAALGAFVHGQYYPSGGAYEAGGGARASWALAGVELGKTCYVDPHEGVFCETASLTPMVTAGYVWLGLRVGFGRDAAPVRLVLGGGVPIAL